MKKILAIILTLAFASRMVFGDVLLTVMTDTNGVVVKPSNFAAANVASNVNAASVSNALNAASVRVKGGLANGAYGDTNNFVLQALYGASWGNLSTNVLSLYPLSSSLGNAAYADTNTMKVFGATNADTLVPAASIGSDFSTNILAITGSEDDCANGYVFWQGTEYSAILGTDCYDILNMIAYFPTPVPHWEIYLDNRGFTVYTNSSPDPTATYRLTQEAIDGGMTVPVAVSKAKISFAASNVVVRGAAYVSSLFADGTIETKGRLLVTGDILSNGSLSVNNIIGNTIQGQSFVGDGSGITGILNVWTNSARTFFVSGLAATVQAQGWAHANGTITNTVGVLLTNVTSGAYDSARNYAGGTNDFGLKVEVSPGDSVLVTNLQAGGAGVRFAASWLTGSKNR